MRENAKRRILELENLNMKVNLIQNFEQEVGSWRFRALGCDAGCSFPGLKQSYNSLILILNSITEWCLAVII